MSRKKGLKDCPHCGSRNLLLEGYSSKGLQVIHCAECDEIFEVFIGPEEGERGRGTGKKSDLVRRVFDYSENE